MRENEVIDTLKMNRPFGGSVFTDELQEALETATQALEEIQQYREIGTVEEFKALKEKSVAKKPDRRYATAHTWDAGYCPVCGCGITARWSYCQNCGQRIDWSK